MIKCLNILLYSNIYIACCAVAMTLQTILLLQLNQAWLSPLVGLVFCATLIVYALHRLISLSKISTKLGGTRFEQIALYQNSLKWLLFVALLLAAAFAYFLSPGVHLILVPAACISFAYVLPFIGTHKKRLRDIAYLKIFLIAFVWSFVTVALPIINAEQTFGRQEFLMLLERFLFIFTITLPFDIRDLAIDNSNAVRTIPTLIGTAATLNLGYISLFAWLALVLFTYGITLFVPFCLTASICFFLLRKSTTHQHDYFFTAGVDGLMLIQFLLVYGWLLT